MLSGLDADLQFLRLGIEQEKTVRFSELHGTFLLKGGSCHAQSVTSGKGLSIGCQFSILLGTYYPRNTPPPLAQSVLGLPWLTIKASQASCLWFLRGGVATDVIFSRTY